MNLCPEVRGISPNCSKPRVMSLPTSLENAAWKCSLASGVSGVSTTKFSV